MRICRKRLDVIQSHFLVGESHPGLSKVGQFCAMQSVESGILSVCYETVIVSI